MKPRQDWTKESRMQDTVILFPIVRMLVADDAMLTGSTTEPRAARH